MGVCSRFPGPKPDSKCPCRSAAWWGRAQSASLWVLGLREGWSCPDVGAGAGMAALGMGPAAPSSCHPQAGTLQPRESPRGSVLGVPSLGLLLYSHIPAGGESGLHAGSGPCSSRAGRSPARTILAEKGCLPSCFWLPPRCSRSGTRHHPHQPYLWLQGHRLQTDKGLFWQQPFQRQMTAILVPTTHMLLCCALYFTARILCWV